MARINRITVHIVAREFFQVSLVTYLLLTLAETLDTGFVSNFFNLNWLLLVVMATGVAMVLSEERETVFGEMIPGEAPSIIPLALVEIAVGGWQGIQKGVKKAPVIMDGIRRINR